MNKKTMNIVNFSAAALCAVSALVAYLSEEGSSASSTFAIIGTVFAVVTVGGIIFKNVKFKD